MEKLFTRKKTFAELTDFLNEKSKTAGLCYFRGRRRVGKSTCLESMSATYPKRFFYFMGRPDEKASQALLRCTKAWDSFVEEKVFGKFKSSELNWDLFFETVIHYGKGLKINICLAFDEIQWIAKERSSFLGALKEHWIKIEKIPQIRIIICGSSYKFFHQMTGGEEKLIRGLKTRSDIWLKPLTLPEIKTYYRPNFSDQELLLAYAFLGGIPYYWNQIHTELNFIQAINRACFIPTSIFLEEYAEMLNLEFQKNSMKNIILILEQIKGSGKTEAAIIQDAKLPQSTVGDLLTKLENYGLVFNKMPLFGKPRRLRSALS
jgi:predicted AAA+ superfamily ATPase